MPMMISTIFFLVLVVISVLLGPETKGKTLTADIEVTKVVAPLPRMSAGARS
jgi:SHS family lactate transporter-like MFS transporter